MTDINQDSIAVPHHIQEYGQQYIGDVVTTWQLLRQRNIDNAHRAQNIEAVVVQSFKKSSKQITDHEQFMALMQTIPSLTNQISDINSQLTTLFSDITCLESERSQFIEVKNDTLIKQHREKKKSEYQALESKLKHEYALHEKWVMAQRNKQLTKAIEQYKIDLEKAYDDKLKQLILQSNTPIIPLTEKTSEPGSNTSSTPHKQSQPTSLLASPTPTPLLVSSTSQSSKVPQTPLLRGASFSTQKSEGECDDFEAKKRQTAIEILEMYANEAPFDDDYIQ